MSRPRAPSIAGVTHWLHPDLDSAAATWDTIDSVCIGTGRFLRAVLVPILTRNGSRNSSILIQPRGRSFLDSMAKNRHGSYDIDTLLHDGSMETSEIPVAGAFSWGDEASTEAFYDMCLPKLINLQVIGIGVTEAGLATADTPIMKSLYQFLSKVKQLQQENPAWREHREKNPSKFCIIDMDNVPNNGTTLRQHMLKLAAEDPSMFLWLESQVAFLDTMVDRITSQREGSNGLVPRAEPVPAKALVVLDPHSDLPPWVPEQQHQKDDDDSLGLVIRTNADQLQADLALKLRIANGTHTALAHVMALLQCPMTDILAHSGANPLASTLMAYVDALVSDQILPAVTVVADAKDAQATWDDWRSRLSHAHFGLSTFFISQNGAAKGGIRLGPTVASLLRRVDSNESVSVTMAFAFAVLLRFLTPQKTSTPTGGVYKGWLPHTSADGATISYADGLRYNFHEGWYEFKCSCSVTSDNITWNLADFLLLQKHGQNQPVFFVPVVRAYLMAAEGGDLSAVAGTPGFNSLCQAVATLYARMLAGDDLHVMLWEMQSSNGPYAEGWSTPCRALADDTRVSLAGGPLYYRPCPVPSTSLLMSQSSLSLEDLPAVVASEVAGVSVVDLHTHLLPPTHGPLCLWGIDELLTYHYLVAEYFITAPPDLTPAAFYAKTKQEQADLIWQALFIDRSPVSEACRGVVTTLVSLGLQSEVRARNLIAIRAFYASYRDMGADGAESFSSMVFTKAGVRYNIMTNIPFSSTESQYWRPKPAAYSSHYRSALRVDPLLAGDRSTVESALKAAGYEVTLEGARQYLRDWCDIMKPEYLMASTPHDFTLPQGSLAYAQTSGSVNTEAMKEPGAFAKAQMANDGCNTSSDDTPSLINENSDFLSEVLMKVCEERDLPLALKIGAHRGVNPELKAAGDGMIFADAAVLSRLCTKYPRVRFLGRSI
eukprot:scaffold10087_cov166-Amphora_coffeaeformis.AAC.6